MPNTGYPTLYEGTTPVEPETTPEEGYHLMDHLVDPATAIRVAMARQ
jgi:arylsulfatase